MYSDATFAYRYVQYDQTVSYLSLGSTTGKCNIMGYWHASNTGTNIPSSSVLKVDTAICTDACTVALCGFSSSITKRPDRATRRPLVDFAGSDALLSTTDYSLFPDLQMFPAVGGAVVPIYNIPALAYQSAPLVLSRATIANIFLGIHIIHYLYYRIIINIFIMQGTYGIGMTHESSRITPEQSEQPCKRSTSLSRSLSATMDQERRIYSPQVSHHSILLAQG